MIFCLSSMRHGKQRQLSWKSHGILLSDFCANPDVRLRFSWFNARRHGPEREKSSDHGFQEERDASPDSDRRGGSVTTSLYIMLMGQDILICCNNLCFIPKERGTFRLSNGIKHHVM